MGYRVKMIYAGEEEYLDEIFNTFEEAQKAGCDELSAFSAGADVLELAGEPFMDPDDADFEVEEE